MTIAQAIKLLIDDMHLTNYKLAKDLGVHPTTVANWLAGIEPRKEHVLKLSSYFGVPISFIMCQQPFTNWEYIYDDLLHFLGEIIDLTGINDFISNYFWEFKITKAHNAPISKIVRMLDEIAYEVNVNPELKQPFEIKIKPDWKIKQPEGLPDIWMRTQPAEQKERPFVIHDEGRNSAFFRLKKGLEPYGLTEGDVDFLLAVYKAHKEKNE